MCFSKRIHIYSFNYGKKTDFILRDEAGIVHMNSRGSYRGLSSSLTENMNRFDVFWSKSELYTSRVVLFKELIFALMRMYVIRSVS